jgi:phage-related protein
VPLYNAGNAYLQVVPSFKGIESLMKKELAKLGAQVDGALDKAVTDGFGKGAKAAVDDAEGAGKEAAGAYAAAFEKRVGQVLKSLGDEVEINIGAKTEDFERAYNKIVKQAKELSEQEIGPDFDAKTAASAMDNLVKQMRELEKAAPDLDSKFNLRQAQAEAHSFIEDLRRNGAAAGTQFGQRVAGGFSDAMKKGVTDTLATLPEYKLDADTTPAQRKVLALRELLSRLEADIKLGLDDSVALSRLRVIVGELEQLDRYEADPSVSANANLALTKLAAVRQLMDRIDGDNVEVKVDVDGDGRAAGSLRQIAEESGVTLSRLGYLVSFGGALGTTLVPAAAAAAVAISGIGFAAIGAVAGLGTLFLAFNGIGDAVKALHTYNQDADKSAKSLAQSTNAIASAMDSVKSAQDQLAAARDNAAKRERDNQVKLRSAIEDVAEQRKKGQQAVRDATADAIDADRDYKEAMDAQREARLALNEAYRQAVRDLAELNSQVKRNALDQRQARLDEIEAKEELDKILTNPRATEEEREQARITYERRILQIEDLKRKGEELAEESDKANKAGIEGSKAVSTAKDKLAEADAKAARAAADLTKAQDRLKEQQIAAPKAIAQAEESLRNLRLDIAKDQRSDQRAIAAAQRQIAAANRQLAQSYTNAATAGGDALDTLRDKMADLSPAGRAFVYFLDQVMRPAMDKLQKAAQEGLFPGLTEGLTELISGGRLDAFADFVYDVADAMGDSFAYAVDQLNDPVWKEFFGYIGQTAGPIIRGATTVALNFAKGIAGIMNALTGFNPAMGNGLLGLSESFAKWGSTLSSNKGFQAFIEYVRQEGPHVVGLLKQVAIFLFRIAVAAAPIGAILVRAFEKFFEFLNKIPTRDLTMIIAGIMALSVALLALAAGTAIAAATAATLWTVAIAAIGIALGFLYNHFEGFRKAVNATFKVAGAVITWLWKNVWIPFYTALWKGIVWLYQNVVVPYISGLINRFVSFGQHLAKLWPIIRPAVVGIGNGIKWLYEKAIRPALGAIGALFQWVWNRVIKPLLDYWNSDTEEIAQQQKGAWDFVASVLRGVGTVLSWLWNSVIKPAFSGMKTAFSAIGAAFSLVGAALSEVWNGTLYPIFAAFRTVAMELYNNYIGPYFRLIGAVISWVWENVAKPVFGFMWKAFQFLGGIFMSVVKAVIKPAWDIIVVAVRVAWAIIKVIFGLIQIAVKILAAIFVWLYRNAVKPIFGFIAAVISGIWKYTIKPTFDLIKLAITSVGRFFSDLYYKYIKPVIDDYIKPAIQRLKDLIGPPLKKAFQDAVKIVGTVWKGLVESVKAPIRFVVNTVLNDGLLAGYNWLAKKFHVKPDDVKIDLPKGFAVGGEIDGPGTGTSDSVLIRASRGEHMWTAREVQAAGGHDAMYSLRRAVLGGWLPGFAKGGAIGRRRGGMGDGFGAWLKNTGKAIAGKATDAFKSTVDFIKDPIGSLTDLAKGFLEKIPGKDTYLGNLLRAIPEKIVGGLKSMFNFGGSGGEGAQGSEGDSVLGGSAGMMRILRGVFPGLPLNSGFRPGAITATGNPSMHGKNRAVDVPPRMDVFDWIHQNFPNSYELIFSPAGGRQLYRGQPHMYSGITRQMHYNHVHWSYDNGGFLQPGMSMVYNGTGKPEPVLTSQQWDTIRSNVKGGDGGPSEVHHWETAGTTITPEWLEANQRRRDAMSRINRRNH